MPSKEWASGGEQCGEKGENKEEGKIEKKNEREGIWWNEDGVDKGRIEVWRREGGEWWWYSWSMVISQIESVLIACDSVPLQHSMSTLLFLVF